MARRVFVDTNCFLHLRDLKDLPWREVFAGEQVFDIYVSAVVVDELDRLKTEKTGRLRDRARAALKLIEAATDQPGMRLELRAANPQVWLVVAQSPRFDWDAQPRLDPSRADDQLVASVWAEPGDQPAYLLSYDTGPLIRARSIGLSAVKAPEAWVLPSQQDPLEKDIARLQRELVEARSTRPKLELSWLDQDATGLITCVLPDLPPLSEAVQVRLLERLRAEQPPSHVVARRKSSPVIPASLGGIHEFQVTQYNHDYATFLEQGREQFATLHSRLGHALLFGEVGVKLENVGQVTAEGLRIVLGASPAHLFGAFEDMEYIGGSLQPLVAPDPPRDHELISPFLREFDFEEPDPTAFYWAERARKSARGVLTNDEFRPAQIWETSFFLGAARTEVQLEIEVHGRNLPGPVKAATRVRVEPGVAGWNHPAVLARMPDWMAEIVSEG